jgi:hypothetical protein
MVTTGAGSIVAMILFFIVMVVGFIALTALPDALRKRGILTGPPVLKFWRMMLLRAVVVVALGLWLPFAGPTGPPNGKYPVADSMQDAMLITIVVIVVGMLWDVVSRAARWFRS